MAVQRSVCVSHVGREKNSLYREVRFFQLNAAYFANVEAALRQWYATRKSAVPLQRFAGGIIEVCRTPRPNQEVFLAVKNYGERERAPQPRQASHHRRRWRQAGAHGVADQMGHNLRIGFGRESM